MYTPPDCGNPSRLLKNKNGDWLLSRGLFQSGGKQLPHSPMFINDCLMSGYIFCVSRHSMASKSQICPPVFKSCLSHI